MKDSEQDVTINNLTSCKRIYLESNLVTVNLTHFDQFLKIIGQSGLWGKRRVSGFISPRVLSAIQNGETDENV